MASPHVAGAAAIYLGLNPTASVAQVAQYLEGQSTKDAISGLKAETVNKLLYVSPTDGAAPIVPPVVAQKAITNITHQSADVLIDVNPGFAATTFSYTYKHKVTDELKRKTSQDSSENNVSAICKYCKKYSRKV